MQIVETLSLGLIQGLTEFIPISSSGHLVIAQNFFAGASDHLFLEFINLGTILALIVFFRKKIIDITRDVFERKKYRLAVNILITAIPAGVVGFLLSGFIEKSSFFGSLVTVTVSMVLVGLIMILLEKLTKPPNIDNGEKLSRSKALAIGLVQVFALIPGVSRSGSTIIAGRLAGMNLAASAEYSFLASIPIMMGVTLKIFMTDQAYLIANFGTLMISNLAAFVAGMFAIGFLMKYLATHSLAVFGWYRLGLATVLTVVILLQ